LSQQVILSTHDLELALDLDRVLVVDAGAVVFDGGPADAGAHYRALCAAGLPARGAAAEPASPELEGRPGLEGPHGGNRDLAPRHQGQP
jgi:biotin transport system ATP-binding protein